MAWKDNICQLPVAWPALSNIPIWGTEDRILRSKKLVALKESIIIHTPIRVRQGGTEVGRGGELKSVTWDLYIIV